MPVDSYSNRTFLRGADLGCEYLIDDEVDLVSTNDEEICPDCGSLLVEYGEDSFELRCPVCELFK